MQQTQEKGRKIATTAFKVVYVLLVIVASLIDGEPMLSAYPEQNEQFKADLAEEQADEQENLQE